MKKSILIIGPHRSGTSALSGALAGMGVDFGNNLLPPSFDNPRGFFENADIVRINDDIFKSLATNWYTLKPLPNNWWKKEQILAFQYRAIELIQKHYRTADLFAIKDPRIALLFPFWKDLLQRKLKIDIHVIIVHRNPVETVSSLMKRNSFSLKDAIDMTLLQLLSAERYSRNTPRNFVSYNNLILNHAEELMPIIGVIDLDVNRIEKFGEFIDTKLSSDISEEAKVGIMSSKDIQQAYDALGKGDKKMVRKMDAIWAKIHRDSTTTSNKSNSFIPLLKTALGSSRTVLTNPLSFLKNLNQENIRILLKAVKEENTETIVSNLKKMLKS